MKELTKSEELILISVVRLKDEASGINIMSMIKERTNKEFVYGTLYSTFEQLVSKGYLNKDFGEPTKERGGKRKLYFKITKFGIEGLKKSLSSQQSVWDGINENVLDGVLK